MKILQRSSWLIFILLLAACDIKDEVPYPVVQGQITAFEVEEQCNKDGGEDYVTEIDPIKRTVTLYVADTTDLSCLRITKIALEGTSNNPDVSNAAAPIIIPDAEDCLDYAGFPQTGFDTLMVAGKNVRMNFTQPVKFVVRTYQDYVWTVKVLRGVKRVIEVENQLGPAIIDPATCRAIVYVKKSQRLDQLKVNTFILDGERGKVDPDPTGTIVDFRQMQKYTVTTGWEETKTWRVAVFKKSEAMSSAWSNFAILKVPFDEGVLGQYDLNIWWREKGATNWEEMSHEALSVDSTDYYVDAKIKGLNPNTPYEYCLCYVNSEDTISNKLETFTTEEQIPLYNGGFENWNQIGSPWYANEAGVSFWDSSNPGSTTLGSSYNVTTRTESPKVSGNYAAKLESRAIVGKFAAASLYVGQFVEMVGTKGAKLDWGRSFTTRPTALKGWMQYAPNAVDKAGSGLPAGAPAKGEKDQCGMFVALLTEAIRIDNTDLSTIPDLETDARVVAYGALPQEQNVDSEGQWKEVNIPLVYRSLTRKPTHLLIVFSASKYGDYFHGGTGTTLYLDDFVFEYGTDPLVKNVSVQNND